MILVSNLCNIVQRLKKYPGSFLVHYSRKDYPWVFVENTDNILSESILKEIGEKLVEKKIIVPILDGEEYKIQFALGVVSGRVYKVNPEISLDSVLLSKDFHYDL